MTGLDTSVLLRLLVGEPQRQAAKAREFLDALFERGEQAAISDLVVSETYFALQYHYGVPKTEALAALRSLLESGEIVGTGTAPEVLRTPRLASSKPGFVDRMIHAQYRAEADAMATFEKRTGRLEGVTVL